MIFIKLLRQWLLLFSLILLTATICQADHVFIGRWIGVWEHAEITIEIYQENHNFFMLIENSDGATSIKKLEQEIIDNGILIFRTLDKDYADRVYRVNKEKMLEIVRQEKQASVFNPVKGATNAILPQRGQQKNHDENSDNDH